ncbi:phosphotransferase family protein [Streptomyces camelliae]|uniref:Aminoglycoside phosphotransferase family protein n=1 Tax=Streptomyces camelliae TaxID=3004093 RepID=A0ABY7NVS7_9ACTN|nr:aminoglycoside phosphotransferase family protein [Streptomyces sp. HUAS 2-6]WBO61637.1 aminoglycoside phosphotransferase family protein [Streptomyces sp. HUAS 2-6]
MSATTALPPAMAEELLHPVLPTESVGETVLRTGGELSTIFEIRFVGAAEPVVIKIYDDRWRWKQEKEIYVYQLLQQHRVGPVPAVLHHGDADNALGRCYTVMTMLRGQPLSAVSHALDRASLREIYRQIGSCMAAVHQIPQGAYGYLTTQVLDPEPTNTAYMTRQFHKKLREYDEHGGDAALATAIEAKVAGQAELLGACRHAVLCHNDFHEGNVLVAGDGSGWQVSGFIDVENAIAADPLMDLAKTDYYSVHGDQDKREALCDGYGTLPADWSERVGLYRLYHALELWDWFASIGNRAPLEGIASDIRRMTA